jgi:NADH-quinone oxidoreductase subunit N
MANVVVSLYYYLMVVRAAYLIEPAAELPKLQVSPAMKFLTSALVAVMVLCGIYPTLVLDLSSAAAAALVK